MGGHGGVVAWQMLFENEQLKEEEMQLLLVTDRMGEVELRGAGTGQAGDVHTVLRSKYLELLMNVGYPYGRTVHKQEKKCLYKGQ